jgi:hypothetical protein
MGVYSAWNTLNSQLWPSEETLWLLALPIATRSMAMSPSMA